MPAARELLFGPLAQELGARAVDAGSGEVQVAFEAGVLAREELEALRRASGGRTELCPAAGAGGAGEERLRAPLQGLARAADLSEAGACLFAAAEAALRRPGPARLMGIVNVTPDSFSDGGRFLAPERAIEHGLALAAEGAWMLDVGGESTRPGSAPVSAEEEARRVLPVIEGLAARTSARIAIDTSKASVARAALERGASLVNDVSAGSDPQMLPLVAEQGAELLLMHMRGRPADMQEAPVYRDVVAEVARFLRGRVAACLKAGIETRRILLDPGIGFGKLLEHNLALLARLAELRSLGLPLCLGASRKSFLAELARRHRGAAELPCEPGRPAPSERIGGSIAALVVGRSAGAELLRVHDVAQSQQALALLASLDGIPSISAHEPLTTNHS